MDPRTQRDPGQTPSVFLPDQPIGSREHDLLGTSPFAAALATNLLHWRGEQSLVVGLFGDWGVGKTSIKNMALEVIDASALPKKPAILEFNPWQVAFQRNILDAFLDDLSVAVGRIDSGKNALKLASVLQDYAAILGAGRSIVGVLRTVFIWVGAVFLLLSLAGVLFDSPGVRFSFLGLSAIMLLAGLAEKLTKALADLLSAIGHRRQQTLAEVKDDLRRHLSALTTPIIVVLDDLDRLDHEDVRAVVQMVKANVDFPHVAYLLLSQRETLERALNEHPSEHGRDFLEKIVQVALDVPTPDEQALHAYLTQGLDTIVGHHAAVRHRFDESRWADVYSDGIRRYFTSLRRVKRYLASVGFYVNIFKNGESFEVNAVDLICLEAFRLFELPLYQRLASSRVMLTSAPGGLNPLDQKDRKRLAESLLQTVPESRRPWVTDVLKDLFPYLDSALGGPRLHADEAVWVRDCRVCSDEMFNRYFQFATPIGGVPQQDIDIILANRADRDKTKRAIRQLAKRTNMRSIFRLLDSYKDVIAPQEVEPFITAIFDLGEDLPEEFVGFFGISTETYAVRIVQWALKQVPDRTERQEVLLRALSNTTGLYLPIAFVEGEYYPRKKQDGSQEFVLDDSSLREACDTCVTRIKAAAESGSLRTHPEVVDILFRWKDWGNQDELRHWVGDWIADTAGLVDFLRKIRVPVRTSTARQSRIEFTVRLDYVSHFVPSMEDLEARLVQIDIAALPSQDQEILRAYFEALSMDGPKDSDDEPSQ